MLCKCSGKYIDIYFILKITFFVRTVKNVLLCIVHIETEKKKINSLHRIGVARHRKLAPLLLAGKMGDVIKRISTLQGRVRI